MFLNDKIVNALIYEIDKINSGIDFIIYSGDDTIINKICSHLKNIISFNEKTLELVKIFDIKSSSQLQKIANDKQQYVKIYNSLLKLSKF